MAIRATKALAAAAGRSASAQRSAGKGGSPRKYRNEPIVVDGVWFASKHEARRWGELQLLQRAGRISNLRRQVKYPLDLNGEHIADYIADAVYVEHGVEVVEDAKGVRTDVFKLKSKMMFARYGIRVREV